MVKLFHKGRKFGKVYKRILKLAPKELAEALEKHSAFWAPEIAWAKLSSYVNAYVAPCSTDKRSVAIYAELCNMRPKDMKAKMVADGL